MLTYIIIAACVLAAIGLIVGFALGYIRLSCWGGAVLGTALICFVVDKAGFIPGDGNSWHGFIMLIVALVTLIVLTLLFALVRRYLKKRVALSQKLSFYRQYDEKEANDERILIALDKKDKKSYRRYSSRRFPQRRGVWGGVDRIFGALTLTVNIFVAVAIVGALALIVIDAAQITAAKDALSVVYDNAFWQGEGSAMALDLIVITLMCMCVRAGYNGGILSALSTLIIIALIGGAGYLAYHLAFNTELFNSAAQGFYDSVLKNLLSGFQDQLNSWQLTSLTIGKIVITAGLFIVMLIPVIIISVFIPRAFDKLRGYVTVQAVDGAVGAVVLTAVVFAVLIFLGALLWQINDLDGFSIFNSYMSRSHVADGLYGDNYVATLSFMVDLPLRSWLGL